MEDKKELKKNKRGRPRIWNTKEELLEKWEEFLKYVKDNKVPMTIERFAVIAGIYRETLLNYSKDDEFFATIKEIKDKITADKLERLNKDTGQKVGIIFDLKNNANFRDKVEIEQINHQGAKSLEELDNWKNKDDQEDEEEQ